VGTLLFVSSVSSLRLLSALRCLGGNIRSGFGELGRGMSSALVGSGYGWDGWFVCLGGGLFSWGGWLRGCGVCVCGACEE
jgi:hypothetical protein